MSPVLLPPDAERELARATPAGLAYVASGGAWIPARHLLLIAERVCKAARTPNGRLMVFMPPRSGKSQLISEYTPPWYLGCFPDRRIILCSYGASLASGWGRKSRDVLEEHGEELFGVKVRSDSKAADRWDIAGTPGGMVTAGVGGAITGKGADLLIIDDPIKDATEAASEVTQERNWDWWRSTARTRLMPNGSVILLQTRWHEDDLPGRLLKHAQEEGGDEWEVLSLPALAETDDDALDRSEGQALWPEFFPEPVLEQTRRALGQYFWAALYQQRPAPAAGSIYKRADFRYYVEDPENDVYVMRRQPDGEPDKPVGRSSCYRFATVDPAFSEKETADYTVISLWAVTPWADLLLLDVQRIRFDVENVGAAIEAWWQPDGKPRCSDIRVESKAFGAKIIRHLARRGLPVRPLRADTDKVTRALSAVPRYEAHAVYHRAGAPWLDEWERELLAFPNAAHDDQADTYAYAALALPGIQAGRTVRTRETEARTETGGLLTADL